MDYRLNDMKRTVLTCLVIALALGAEAQTFKEWFRQKKTQKEYLLKQIAALEVYLDYLKEGYDIVQKGLDIVGNIKNDNLNDHIAQFRSLRHVKGNLGVSGKVMVIMTRQISIMNSFRELNEKTRNSDYLTQAEIRYIDRVYQNLLTECERLITDLNVVLTNESSQMTDESRIERIDEAYADMNDKYSFAQSFCSSTETLIMQRSAERNEVESAQKLNDIL